MSKVKITGNASGTGVLTVEAPNTNTDRTITLPDGTGTLIADNGSGNVGIGTSSPAKELDVSGEIRASSGILFGTDTAAANALDDYEEGTFAPNIQPNSGSITWNTSSDILSYTKIGRVVHITGRLQVSSVSSPSGITRGTRPFNTHAGSEQSERNTGTVLISGTSINCGDFAIYPDAGSTNTLEIIRTNSTSIQRDAGSYLGAGDYIDINLTYFST